MKHILYAALAFSSATTVFTLLFSSLIFTQVGDLWLQLDRGIGQFKEDADFAWAEMMQLGVIGSGHRRLRSAEKATYTAAAAKYSSGDRYSKNEEYAAVEKNSHESQSTYVEGGRDEEKYSAFGVVAPPAEVKSAPATADADSEIHSPAELPNFCSCLELQTNLCPPGAAGAPGPPGLDGHDGTPGVDGYDGFDAYAPAPQTTKACFRCPTGPPGPVGPEGAPGIRGRRGKRGTGGIPGANGNPGYPGDMGPPGPTGPDGTPGERGPNGLDGVKYVSRRGVKGAPGEMGPEGTPGVKGAPGAVGIAGGPGLDGMPGLMGINGMDGELGAPGPEGKTGKDATYCKCPERGTEDEPRRPGYIQSSGSYIQPSRVL